MSNTIIDMHNCITADELEKIVRHYTLSARYLS